MAFTRLSIARALRRRRTPTSGQLRNIFEALLLASQISHRKAAVKVIHDVGQALDYDRKRILQSYIPVVKLEPDSRSEVRVRH
jgi:hypothetical protein